MFDFLKSKKTAKIVDKPTEFINDRLNAASDLDKFLEENVGSMQHPSLAEFLNKYLLDHNIETADFVKKAVLAGFVRQYVYELLDFNKSRKCSQDKLVAIAIILKMTPDEANHMMKYVGINTLYVKNPRDAVLLFALKTGQNMDDTQNLLMDRGFEPLSVNRTK